MAQGLILGRPFELPYPIRRVQAFTFSPTPLLDAAQEEVHFIGQVYLENPLSGPKVISTAGGKIHWRSGATTFLDPGTNLDIGIQDVSAVNTPAQGVTPYSVATNLVGGTDVIPSSAHQITPMKSGDKILSHGQLIAIVFRMNARGGADSVPVATVSTDNSGAGADKSAFPTVSHKTGGSFATLTAMVPNVGIEFDDGTVGWLYGAEFLATVSVSGAVNVNTPVVDEYGTFLQLPAPMTCYGVSTLANPADANADFEVVLYFNPMSANPVVLAKITVDATKTGGGTGLMQFLFDTPILLLKDTPYAISVRPITTSGIVYRFYNFGDLKFTKMTGLGENAYAIRRVDNMGPFVETIDGKVRMVQISALLQKMANDDGTGDGGTGGGGGMTYIQS